MGLLSSLIGNRCMKLVLTALAFVAGTVGSMYPIDTVLGDMLCGPCNYPLDSAQPSVLCQWAAMAGVGIGLVFASAAVKFVDGGPMFMGFGIGVIASIIIQPFVDQVNLCSLPDPPSVSRLSLNPKQEVSWERYYLILKVYRL